MAKKAIKIELNENDDALLYAEKTLGRKRVNCLGFPQGR